ncbi:DUF1177 domain-containing protein (plasmid) [Salinigranum rubrum]|uniref:DUF1177 domain-containing protein n=1 Tax=Salinigranum rubrum TaxID=755307 RepID=A0A2I8VQM7_9EURY|nr:DUF1177 domain-containing protein [Salinigranum rubrum]AUV84184.1 DUF1177 domain-containing protein [Salinigranum rubrum]
MLDNIQQAYSVLDHPEADGAAVQDAMGGTDIAVDVTTIETDKGSTDFVRVTVPGQDPDAPTLGVVGRLGGVGARPEEVGMVSDADGAIVALASAFKLAEMYERGDHLAGEVQIATHVCPDAPTQPHDPVPFMGSPVDMATMNRHEVDEEMDAVLSVDATKGNRVHCERGFAITPTAKEGWLLPPSDALLDIQERVTGEPPSTLTLTTQDITPYGNDVHHINSLMQPATATDAPVVGVATTSTSPIPGSGTGANYLPELLEATGFVVETAKEFTRGRATLYDRSEFERLQALYGSMDRLQTMGTER